MLWDTEGILKALTPFVLPFGLGSLPVFRHVHVFDLFRLTVRAGAERAQVWDVGRFTRVLGR